MDSVAETMVIHVQDLVKAYGSFAVVNGVSFSVARGEIFGVLGPNGAGKTTTLETMIGMREPTTGHVRILGYNPCTEHSAMAKRVCIQPQHATLFDHLTVEETIDLFAGFYEHPLPVGRVIAEVGLEDKRSILVKKLSGGQRQRLLVGVALVANGDILFLDEPTGSLDPQARRQLWDVVLTRRDEGKSIILTTHSMEEAQALCDRVAIMHRGRVLAIGTPMELIKHYFPEQLIVYETPIKPDLAALERLPGVVNVLTMPAGINIKVRITTAQTEDTLRELLANFRLAASGGFHLEQGTLEDVFLALVGRNHKEGVS